MKNSIGFRNKAKITNNPFSAPTDARTSSGRRYRDILKQLVEDFGGESFLTPSLWDSIRRIAGLSVYVEAAEKKMLESEDPTNNSDEYLRACGLLRRYKESFKEVAGRDQSEIEPILGSVVLPSFDCDNKLPDFQGMVVFDGIQVKSRYSKTTEIIYMMLMLHEVPKDIRKNIKSIWCDTPACTTYSVDFNVRVTGDVASRVLKYLASAAMKYQGHHNGFFARSPIKHYSIHVDPGDTFPHLSNPMSAQ